MISYSNWRTWGRTDEAHDDADEERPRDEARVPGVLVTDEDHPQEQVDHGLARIAGNHQQQTQW